MRSYSHERPIGHAFVQEISRWLAFLMLSQSSDGEMSAVRYVVLEVSPKDVSLAWGPFSGNDASLVTEKSHGHGRSRHQLFVATARAQNSIGTKKQYTPDWKPSLPCL